MNTFDVPGVGELGMTNRGTDVFYDLLTLAACDLAESPWELNLALDFADGHRYSRGMAGHDLNEWPWTGDWRREKAFLLRVIDLVEERHGWDRLDYEPSDHALSYFVTFRTLVEGLIPTSAPVERPIYRQDWSGLPSPELLERCPRHRVFLGQCGCRFCEDW